MTPFPLLVRRRTDSRPRVLLVDEHLERRYAMAQTLRSEGCDVHSASGQESWLNLFKSCLTEPAAWVSFVAAVDPDLLMLDMDHSMALVTLHALRRHPLTDQIPIVAVGDGCDASTLQTAQALGAARLLRRPWGLSGLRMVVDSVIAEAPPRSTRSGDERPGEVVN